MMNDAMPKRQNSLPFAMRLIYNLVLFLLLAALFPIGLLIIHSKKKWRRSFRRRWAASPVRLNNTGDRADYRRPVWIHALSVGEIMAADPLIRSIRSQDPKRAIVVSATTMSGFAMAEQRFGSLGCRVVFYPYDFSWCVKKRLCQINPSAVVLIETDIWPNFLMELNRRGIPAYAANIRLSDATWKMYRRFGWIAASVFGCFTKIGVQSQRDADRFVSLGVPAEQLCVTGNIKFDTSTDAFDADAPRAWRRKLGIDERRKVIVAGSTHQGEEAALVRTLAAIDPGQTGDGPLLIIAPRDPARARAIRAMALRRGMAAVLYSGMRNRPADETVKLLIVDVIGILNTLYACADIAFVGGSLTPCGGHNPLEPAAWGKPVLFGPDMRDFAQIAQWLVKAGGACRVSNQDELTRTIKDLLTMAGRSRSMGACAQGVFLSHKGAVARTLTCFNLL